MGLAMIFHRLPFQCSMSVRVVRDESSKDPTAHTSLDVTADTALRAEEREPGGVGLVATLHAVPFQCSVRPAELRPTAHASLPEMAATPARKEPAVPTFGLGRMDHKVPSQCSVSVLYRLLDRKNPTAQASVEDSAELAASSLMSLPTFGVGTTAQTLDAAACHAPAPREIVTATAAAAACEPRRFMPLSLGPSCRTTVSSAIQLSTEGTIRT